MSTTQKSRASYLTDLRNRVQEVSSPKTSFQKSNDDRYWKPTVDKLGNASAIIRFLPMKATSAGFPFIQLWNHGYKDVVTDKWFIDNCPSSLGGIPSDVCPVCADNNRLYNISKDKECPHKKIASGRKRKLNYVSNILVINDPKVPENNGKVFLYRYGKSIFDLIKDKMFPAPPEFEDQPPTPVVDPYDMEAGANFRLRQVKKDNFPNFQKSTFDPISAIGDADYIASIEAQLYDLEELLDPKHFKTYEKLAERFAFVSGVSAPTKTSSGGDSVASKPSIEDGIDDDAPVARPRAAPARAAAPVKAAAAPAPRTAVDVEDESDDPENEDYFSKLAAESAASDD